MNIIFFVPIRARDVAKELQRLDVSKAAGPDKISAFILRRLAHVLAIFIAILCRRILFEACWPEQWKLHHLVPIFKRGVAFLAKNYRGVHLTCVIAKIVERIIGKPLIQHLQLYIFGENRWAFTTKKRTARDLVYLCVRTWIFAICTKYKIGAFLKNITGTFDRVFKKYFMAKLNRAGIDDVYLIFSNAFFESRIGRF